MTVSPLPSLSHVGLYVWDLPRMIEFYTQTFGLIVTDRGFGRTTKSELVFLSGRPEHHHQLVLSTGRPRDVIFSTVMQLSFLVMSIDDLRRLRERALNNGAGNLLSLNHGTSLSIYADDPERNRIEIYYETSYYISQPRGEHLNLDQPNDDILRETEEICRGDKSFMLRDEWKRSFLSESARHHGI